MKFSLKISHYNEKLKFKMRSKTPEIFTGNLCWKKSCVWKKIPKKPILTRKTAPARQPNIDFPLLKNVVEVSKLLFREFCQFLICELELEEFQEKIDLSDR